MRIHHVALYVGDLERSRRFYETWFGFRANPVYHNPRTGLSLRFLDADGSCRLEIMRRPDVPALPDRREWEGFAHIAIGVADRAAVDSLTERLRLEGVPVESGPRVTGDGCYESRILDPDGNRVEIVAESGVA